MMIFSLIVLSVMLVVVTSRQTIMLENEGSTSTGEIRRHPIYKRKS